MDFGFYLERIEHEISLALPVSAQDGWLENSFGTLYEAVLPEHISPLLAPTRSLVDLGGKRWRPLLLVLCAESYSEGKTDTKKALDTAFHLVPLVEFIHTASLIHDDIEDKADTRRGKPAAHITYGTDTAINAASWLYFEASTCIDTLSLSAEEKLRFYSLYAKETRRLHLGQAMDISWHRDYESFPTPAEYMAMVQCKTGTLASLASQLGILAAGGSEKEALDAGATAAKIGAGFQIIDDVLNLTTGNPGKKRGDDIVEGKKSLPVLLFLSDEEKRGERKEALLKCFKTARKDGIESPAVEKAIALMEESGAISLAREKGAGLINEGCAEYRRMFGEKNSAAQKIEALFSAMIPHEAKGVQDA
ncbi:MAG TPA: polyprenyl synthetase family protein [Treponema sp.]|nr:polyprenyl synthetase family protein [Treponema sp.]